MRRDKPARYKTGGIMKSRLLRLLTYVIVGGAVSLAALEVGLRLYVKAPVLTFRDWRGANSMALESGGKYDEVLGWVQPAHLASDGFNTVEYGIRKNSSRDEPLSRGAVLAVGDSYTVGSEVRDDESWPAQLERLAEIGVINAGVGGYGLDQIVLAAERLLPVVRPQMVIVGVYQETIVRANYRSYGAPKPYFASKTANGTLGTSRSLKFRFSTLGRSRCIGSRWPTCYPPISSCRDSSSTGGSRMGERFSRPHRTLPERHRAICSSACSGGLRLSTSRR
jgi:hypothetical protein